MKNQTSKMTLFDIQNERNHRNELYQIAIIIQAVYIYKQVRPRDIQILSLLLFIENQHKSHGRLAQIRTGEGKSIIVSMCKTALSYPPSISKLFFFSVAVYLSRFLSKPYVDIITTSEILAKRDAEEFAPFYQMFNLTVGHNCSNPPETPNYSVNIIYGTVNHFAGDLLRTEFYLESKVRGDRPYIAAIVDEVDSMFIDQREHFYSVGILNTWLQIIEYGVENLFLSSLRNTRLPKRMILSFERKMV